MNPLTIAQLVIMLTRAANLAMKQMTLAQLESLPPDVRDALITEKRQQEAEFDRLAPR